MTDASEAFTDAVRDFASQFMKKKIPSFIEQILVSGQIVTAEEVQARTWSR